ncbi:MAG: AEC family transporter [Rubritepida sp.]|nr:AEC family transporter [Rubritepida sp.]
MGAVLAAVAPVFVVVGLGWLFAWRGLIDAAGFKGLNTYVFVVAIPALLFSSGTAGHVGGGPAGVAFFAAAFLVYFAVLLGGRALGWGLQRSGPMALDATFGNTVMMGIPLIFAGFGQAGLSILLVIIALHSLLLLTMATVVAELAQNAQARPLALLGASVGGVLRNPIVVSVVAAQLWLLLALPVPEVLRRCLDLLGAAGPPTALFCLGASLLGFNLAAAWRQMAATVVLKLLVLPLLVFGICRLMGLSALETAVATTIAALPTGANAFLLSSRYGTGSAESGAAVLVSSVVSVVTLAVVLGVFNLR